MSTQTMRRSPGTCATSDQAVSDWRHDAACREEDPELFFPVGTTGPALLQIEEAKAVCRRCPVMETCLQWALESGQEAGVWGGMSEDERRAMKRRATRNRATRSGLRARVVAAWPTVVATVTAHDSRVLGHFLDQQHPTETCGCTHARIGQITQGRRLTLECPTRETLQGFWDIGGPAAVGKALAQALGGTWSVTGVLAPRAAKEAKR
jgi:WhiB family redox-sensing transcriptional regulator